MTAYTSSSTFSSVVVTPQASVSDTESISQSVWDKICWWRGYRRGAQNVLPDLSTLDHE